MFWAGLWDAFSWIDEQAPGGGGAAGASGPRVPAPSIAVEAAAAAAIGTPTTQHPEGH